MTEKIQTETEPEEQPIGPVTASKASGAPAKPRKVVRKVDPEERLPFTEHLEELRWRIIYSAITIMVVFIPMYAISEELLIILRRPVPVENKLWFTALTGPIFIYLKISFYSAVILSMPVIIYHIWEFIAPGLLQVERKYTKIFVLFGTLSFAAGAAFCYFVALPVAIPFLIGFGGETLSPILTVQEYISFFFMIIIGFGVAFELPLALIFMMATGITNYRSLARHRGYALIGSVAAGGVLTPTQDPFNMMVLAIPLYLFFEMSLLVGWIFFKPPPPETKEPTNEPAEG
ncbi:MAG: twin-arginine translocase subunit TatC [Nitrospinota bacterium]|nr:twin-arginine translocase subunit TatC [Nitrospinota bacterium]MDH5679549.1 twin-arginine translocase subunit TatC [Nitrospinota bacterium]